MSPALAQDADVAGSFSRRPCVRERVGEQAMTRGTRSVSTLKGEVRVPVILAAYPDRGFLNSDEETFAIWDAMLNQSGYAEHGARGCVADYFREQSQGQFGITFDLYGPVVLPDSMAYYGKNVGNDDRRPGEMIYDACVATEADFSPYDWNGDGVADAVVVVFAGMGENRGGGDDSIWPHMSTVGGKKVGDVYLSTYACVSELLSNTRLDGFGTFVHEFSHCLGLPDLYPVNDNTAYSIFDEWDLMDGGNYSNAGFGVPNYSAFERNLCGWLNLTELSEPASITDMPSLDEQSLAYVVYNDAHPREYYILENRQQRGWDYYIPGNGLLVTHVSDYTKGSLAPNNSSRTQVGLVPADNRNYRQSEALFGKQCYGEDGRNKYLSLAAYPYISDDVANDSLTNNSVPAATLKNKNAEGELFLSRPITDIRMDEQGHVSFDFMMIPTAISDAVSDSHPDVEAYYDLRGQRLPEKPVRPGIYIIRYTDGTTKKSIR